MEASEICVFCNQPIEEAPSTTLTEKGCRGINKASATRKDSICCVPGQQVHLECRRKYCHPSEISKALNEAKQASSTSATEGHVLRSAEKMQFQFNSDCFFCGQPAINQAKRKSPEVIAVRTIELKEKILAVCRQRGDSWAATVQARILPVHDLHAADAVYHHICSNNFRTNKQIPAAYQTETSCAKKLKLGRPELQERTDAFLEVVSYLEENDDEQITISDLIRRMEDVLIESDHSAYSPQHMKMKLQELYGDRIIITEINGKPNVVTFRSTAKAVLQDFYQQEKREPDADVEKIRVVETAAKLIRNDIKVIETTNTAYPTCEEMASEDACINFLPETLRVLLEQLIVGSAAKKKIASVGQAIIQAVRPRVLLAPLQIGLAVQLHHHYASRFLVDSLHHLGFCCSYQQVQEFERSAAISHGTDIPNFSDQSVQYVADNVDHNIRTLDGNNTFHGMGMITTVTPGVRSNNRIPKIKVSLRDLAAVGRVPIQFHKEESTGMTAIVYEKLYKMKAQDPTANLDILWKTSILFRFSRPSWSGMMQFVQKGDHPGMSSIRFLPMVDMNPSDATCIYSTLNFLAEHARRHNATPIVTFDQPLWWKALMIIDTEPVDSDLKNIVLRLGGFHLEMSFLGSIGHLMSASGLQHILELVYAPNAVVHMLTGKAIARAVRAHLLVDAALNGLLLANGLGVPLPSQSNTYSEHEEADEATSEETAATVGTNRDLDEAYALYESLMEETISVDDVCSKDVIQRIITILEEKIDSLKSSRTASLWLQYMKMVDILRQYIRAERTGNWALHLEAISKMLPYLAASGHNHYSKSAWVYLQRMSQLEKQHPDIYRQFQEGLHVVRRSDRLWAGLSTDLVIEQVLMRSMKSSGGLTRGRGMTEQQRLVWVLSMPVCAEVNKAMQELTGVNYDTGEQNRDMTKARHARDWKDTHTILSYLQENSPFASDTSLRSISTGVHACATVNVDKAEAVGRAILEDMEGKTVGEYVFKRANQAVTLNCKSSVKVDGDVIQIDPQLLFQRLTLVAKSRDSLEDVFRFELCSYPPALFSGAQFLREAHKPVLANAIWSFLPDQGIPGLPRELQYVLDGGALLQRIPWAKGATFREICTVYTEYVTRKYGNAVVVFDSYQGKSTKDMTHQRRTKGQTWAIVTFTENMHLTMRKDQFLANKENKQRFINMLSTKLVEKSCKTYHASGDADLLIVQKSVESASAVNTVLIGDDTDLLILLIYHASLDSCSLFLKPEPKKSTKNSRVWNIHAVKKQLGPDICSNILFLHAILGCDTTSQPHGIGKGNSLKKFRDCNHFRDLAEAFNSPSATAEEVATAGEQVLVSMYNGKPGETLDYVRYKCFCAKVARNTSHIQPKTLPPTSAAAKFHSLRVYHQVQQWKGAGDGLLPEEWGWKESEEILVPVTTDLLPAPDDLLRIIRCNCHTDCGTMRCSCKKHGIACSIVCGNCKGSGCMNSTPNEDDSDDDDMNN